MFLCQNETERLFVSWELYLLPIVSDCQYLHESCRDTSEWITIKHILQYLKRKCLQTVFESVSRIEEVHVFAVHIVHMSAQLTVVYILYL